MMQDITAGQSIVVIFYHKYLILKVRETQSWVKLFDLYFFTFIKLNCWRGSF